MPAQARLIATISAAMPAEMQGPASPKSPELADRAAGPLAVPTLPSMRRKTTAAAIMAMAAGASLVRLQGARTAALVKLPVRRHRPGQPIRDAHRVLTAHRHQVDPPSPHARRIAAAGRSSRRTLTVAQVQHQTAAMTVWTRAAASLRWNCTGLS